MFGKPRWYNLLPPHLRPSEEKISKIEDFRKRNFLTDHLLFIAIGTSPWAVRKVQEFCLEQNRKIMPNVSEKELWKSVLFSRFQTKLATPSDYYPPWATPLSQEEILLRIDNISSIMANFKAFEDVVDYVLKMDEEEGAFSDPTGISNELNEILNDKEK